MREVGKNDYQSLTCIKCLLTHSTPAEQCQDPGSVICSLYLLKSNYDQCTK